MTVKHPKLIRLENMLSDMSGAKVDITIRDINKFTMSFDGDNPTAAKSITDYFKSSASDISMIYDQECDCTAIYINV
jgi:hypothetical protein